MEVKDIELQPAKNKKKTISVIGLGIVGLTTAIGFSMKGHKVIGVDIDKEKVGQINNKICPTYEPGLARAMRNTKIVATTDYDAALESDISFICGVSCM